MNKKIIAAMMALLVGFTSLPSEGLVFGSQTEQVTAISEGEGSSGTGGTETGDSQAREEAGTEESEISEAKEAALKYIMVESDYLETPGTQNIVVGIGTENMELTDLELHLLHRETGETVTVPVTAKEQDLALFTMDFADENRTGVYQVTGISYRYQGREQTQDAKQLGIEAVFGVNREAQANPDDILVDEEALAEIEANVVQMDENGNVVSENTIENVMEQGLADGIAVEQNMKAAGNVVVVLDPGHDSTHTGAWQNGAKEEELTLKIAQYCREELNTYSGITVYMVRETSACPYASSGWISSGVCNENRVAFASSVGANVYVSFHLNSSSSSSVNGVGVYYPNTNYRPDLSETGKQLAQKIYEKLSALGLTAWAGGILTQNSSDYKYDDGSVADYLGVIRNCKKVGIAAVLIEHAFLSGTYDYNTFLNSDEKLKALGVADATAIAEKFGLTKGSNKVSITSAASVNGGKIRLTWKAVDKASYYEIYRSTNKDSGYQLITTVSNALSYKDKDINLGTAYYYIVRAVFPDYSAGDYSDPAAGLALKKASLTSVSSVGAKKLELKWKKVKGAAGYYIFKQNAAGNFEKIATVTGGGTTSYIDTVSKKNTVYSYQVQAYHQGYNKVGTGSVSAAGSGKTVGVPTGLTVAAVDDTTLQLSWKRTGGAKYFEIYRSTKENGTYKKIKTTSSGSVTSYTDKKVTTGKTYYYKIQAVNEYEGQVGYSGLSKAVGGKTVARTSITAVQSVDSTTLKITWKKIDDAYGYRIKRSDAKNGTYKVIKTIAKKDTLSYQDTKRVEGKTYYYKVETLGKMGDTIGYSGDSPVKGGRTVAMTSIRHVAPTEEDALEIAWEEVEGAWGYYVKRSTSKKGSYQKIATIKRGDVTEYTDDSAKANTQYYYVVETINQVGGKKGVSGNCEAVAGKTLASSSFTTIKALDSKTIQLNWKKVSGANGYLIFRSAKKNGTYSEIAAVKGANTLTYSDKTVTADKSYYYKIQAYQTCQDTQGVSKLSAPVKAWTVGQVQITGVTGTSGGKVTLKWDEVKNASSYSVYRKEAGGSFKKVKEVKAGAALKYADSEIEKGAVYSYRIAANTIITGTTVGRGTYSKTVTVPVLAKAGKVTGQLEESSRFALRWKAVENAGGYELECSLQQDKNFTKLVTTAETAYTHQNLQQGVTYYYRVRAYATLSDGSTVYGPWSTVNGITAGHMIMGDSSLTVQQMLSYYEKAGYTYPGFVYTEKGAETAEAFFTILQEEAKAEGVRTEVLFAQVILETGGLSFGGDVAVWQCNFGGIGATGNGVPGETFPDVRTGLRAQTQHLKAYASTDPLNQECVDPRFKYVKRGSAPYIEWLAIPKNPNGGGWAADPDYAVKLLNIINKL